MLLISHSLLWSVFYTCSAIYYYILCIRSEKEKPGEDEEEYAEISPPPFFLPQTQNSAEANTTLDIRSPNPSLSQVRFAK